LVLLKIEAGNPIEGDGRDYEFKNGKTFVNTTNINILMTHPKIEGNTLMIVKEIILIIEYEN